MRRIINFIPVFFILVLMNISLSGETIPLEFRDSKKAKITGFTDLADLHFLPLHEIGEDVANAELPIPGDITINVFCAEGKYQVSLCLGKEKNKTCLPPENAGMLWYPQFVSFEIPWAGKTKRTIQIRPGGGERPKWVAYRFMDAACGKLNIGRDAYIFALYSHKEDGRFDDAKKVTFLLDVDKDGELLYGKDWSCPGYEIVDASQPFQIGKTAFRVSIDAYGLKTNFDSADKGLPLTTALAGSPAPQMMLKDLNGQDSPLLQSRVTFLYFFDSKNYDQRYWLKRMEPVFEYLKNEEKKGKIEIVGISLEASVLQTKIFAGENNLPGRILTADSRWESEIVKTYHIMGIQDLRLVGLDRKFWPVKTGKDDEELGRSISFALNYKDKEAGEYLKRESLKAGFLFKMNLYTRMGETEKAEKLLDEFLISYPELAKDQSYDYFKKQLETEGFEKLPQTEE